MLLAMASLFVRVAAAVDTSCVDPLAAEPWSVVLDRAESAYANLDEPAFDAALQEAAETLPCLADVLPPTLAARYHRLVGLRLYVRRDMSGAELAFAAANAVDPFGALPSELLPPGHEGRVLADGAHAGGATRRAPAVASGTLWFDGTATRDRPVDRPTILQVQQSDRVTESLYLAPDAPLPAYPAVHPARRAAHVGLGVASGVFAIGAVALYALADEGQNTLDGPLPASQWQRGDVLALQRRTNTMVAASGASALLGGVALGAALVRW